MRMFFTGFLLLVHRFIIIRSCKYLCLIWTQAAMEPSMPGHAPHNVPGRSAWGGLNVAYEMQQDPNKPG